MPDKVTGLYVTAERITRGLVVTLTDEGREELKSYVRNDSDEIKVALGDEIFFTKSHVSVWSSLIFDMEASNDLHMLSDDEYAMLGALTSSPIIVTMPTFSDDNELRSFDAAFWFPSYQIESELETLVRKGEVTFDLASEPQDLNTCECGFQTYIVERMHTHTDTCGKVKR